MMLARRLALPVVFLLLLLTPDLLADVIVFKTGGQQVGKIVEETETHVVMEVEGVGKVTYSRVKIKEIQRKGPQPDPGKKGERGELLRFEDCFVWSGDRRIGTRSVRIRRMPDGTLRLEERTVFYDAKGVEEARIFLDEHTDATLEPKSFVYRVQTKDGSPLRTVRGTVRDGSIHLSTSLPGKRDSSVQRLPEGVRFPLSAREQMPGDRSCEKALPESTSLPEVFERLPYQFAPASCLSRKLADSLRQPGLDLALELLRQNWRRALRADCDDHR